MQPGLRTTNMGNGRALEVLKVAEKCIVGSGDPTWAPFYPHWTEDLGFVLQMAVS